MELLAETNCSQLDFTNKTCFKLDKYYFDLVFWVKSSMCILTVLVCCLSILLIFVYKAYQRFVYRFVLYITIPALVDAIAITLESAPLKNECGYIFVTDEILCVASGFLDQYSSWVIFLLISWITTHMFVLAVFNKNYKSRKCEAGAVLICYFVPVIISIIPFINFKNDIMYGLSGVWCWIKVADNNCKKYKEGTIEQFTLWYGPIMLITAINFIVMIVVILVLTTRTRSHQLQKIYKAALKETFPLLLYPIIFGAIYGLGVINRIVQAITNRNTSGLIVVHAFAASSICLFIPLAFLLHPYTLKKLTCLDFRKVANQWKHHSLRSHTHFVVSKHNTCDASDHNTLIIGGSENAATYNSFLNIDS